MTYSFQHISGIRCIVEETSTLAGGALLLQRGNVSGDHRTDDVLWADTL
jgi:hypothetical protein